MGNTFYLPASDHGGNASEIEKYLSFEPMSIHDLSMSMNPFIGDLTHLFSRLSPTIYAYPNDKKLQYLFAEIIGIDPKYLLLTNGAAEAITLVANVLKVARVIQPEFSLWERHLLVVSDEAKPVRSNPCNPTGKLADGDERALVFDEAFYPLATGRWTRRDFEDNETIVIGSFTKLMSIPGLRVGYIICYDEAKLAAIERNRPAWSVGSFALAVVEHLLLSIDLDTTRKNIVQRQSEVKDIFTSYQLEVKHNEAPWILIENAPWLRYFFALEKFLVRDCSSFGLPNTLRVGLPNDIQLKHLPSALERALNNADNFFSSRNTFLDHCSMPKYGLEGI